MRNSLTDLGIDDPYSIEQLRDPRMNISVVRPLVDKLYELDDVSISKSDGALIMCKPVGLLSERILV